ncbi:hypothetical protein ACWC09_35805 [Streptomyces sp. NPDC001617]
MSRIQWLAIVRDAAGPAQRFGPAEEFRHGVGALVSAPLNGDGEAFVEGGARGGNRGRCRVALTRGAVERVFVTFDGPE